MQSSAISSFVSRVFIFIFFLLIISCTGPGKKKQQPAGSADNSTNSIVILRLDPTPGHAYSYESASITEIKQEIQDQELTNHTNLKTGIRYVFQKDAAGQLVAEAKYTGFNLHMNIADTEKEIDAATAAQSSSPSERVFAAFHQATVSVIMDSTGTVKSVSGTEKIRERMQQLAGGDAGAMQMLQTTMRQYMGDEFFRKTVEQSFKVFTAKPLHVGDTIVKTNDLNAGLPISLQTVFTVESIGDEEIEITSAASIDLKEKPLSIEGASVIATLKGSQKGTMRISRSTGMVTTADTDLKLSGELQIMGTTVPIGVKMNNRLKLAE